MSLMCLKSSKQKKCKIEYNWPDHHSACVSYRLPVSFSALTDIPVAKLLK